MGEHLSYDGNAPKTVHNPLEAKEQRPGGEFKSGSDEETMADVSMRLIYKSGDDGTEGDTEDPDDPSRAE